MEPIPGKGTEAEDHHKSKPACTHDSKFQGSLSYTVRACLRNPTAATGPAWEAETREWRKVEARLVCVGISKLVWTR